MKKNKYLITGCAGFIGSNLVKRFHRNSDLILVDDLSEGSVSNLPKKLRKQLIKKRIQDIKNFKTKKLDGIFHLAAQSSVPLSLTKFYKSSSNNIQSSLRVFEISKKFAAPIVYASSSAVYGNLPLGNDKSNKFSITSPYAQDKLIVENYAKMLFEIFKVPSVGLRLFNVYGPGQRSNSPYSAVVQKIKKKKIFQIFNVGTGRSVNINYLFKLIKKVLRVNPKVKIRKLDKFDPRKSSGTFKKINNFLKLKKYNYTRLENGIVKTVNFKKN